MNYLTQSFFDNFRDTYHGNFTFKIKKLTIYETQSYYIDVKLQLSYLITTKYNLSNWNFTDEILVQVPVSGLYDPELLARGGKKIQIRSSEFHLPTMNWTKDNFEETVKEMYSTVFYKPDFDYTIGQSYLKRLLGITTGGFYKVITSLSFDLDEHKLGIYDTVSRSVQGELFGNTLMLLDFDNSTSSATHILDKAIYNSQILKTPNMICTSFGNVIQENCLFTKKGIITDSIYPITFSDRLSISVWINPTVTTTDLIILGNDVFKLGIDKTSKELFFEFENITSSFSNPHFTKVYSNTSINNSKWTHVVFTYSGSQVLFYINGIFETQISVPAPTIQTILNQYIGTNTTNSINLSIDELGLYSSILTSSQITSLYHNKKATHIDYVDSVFTKGINFDGIDDYAKIKHNDSLKFGTGDFSVCTWFKTPEIFGTNSYQQILVKRNNPPSAGNFEIEFSLSTKKLKVLVNDKSNFTTTILKENNYYFSCFTRESGLVKIYLNGELESSFTSVGNVDSNNDIYLGNDPFVNQYFKGLIDEIKIYNVSLQENEIKLNYRNYQSFGKGCCNYVTIINQNLLGYNTASYTDQVSSTSTLFYDNYIDSNWYNITLFNSSFFTSLDTSQEYYNLLLDVCMYETYNYLDYDTNATIIPSLSHYEGIVGSNNCNYLISQGYY